MRRTLLLALFASLVLVMPAQAQRPVRRGFAQRPRAAAVVHRSVVARQPVVRAAPRRRPGPIARVLGIFRGVIGGRR